MDPAAKAIQGAGRGRRQVRILFSSAGRRVELIQAFVRAAKALDLDLEVHAADVEPHFAAACAAHKAHQVPLTSSPDYIQSLLDIAGRERIDLLVPLIDLELVALSEARERFAAVGCHPIISAPQVVHTCSDKLATFKFLTAQGVPVPQTWLPEEFLKLTEHRFPCFLKPRRGSASKGNMVVRDELDLRAGIRRVPDCHPAGALGRGGVHAGRVRGYYGRPRCVVPRRRVEVRGGEVTKSLTVRPKASSRPVVRVVQALADCVGLITIQLFLQPDGGIHVIEINPRFGAGPRWPSMPGRTSRDGCWPNGLARTSPPTRRFSRGRPHAALPSVVLSRRRAQLVPLTDAPRPLCSRGPLESVQLSGIRTVVFDLDDTLTAERSFAFSGLRPLRNGCANAWLAPPTPRRECGSFLRRNIVADLQSTALGFGCAQADEWVPRWSNAT